jgi:class 3 adenylate cyclase/tetratricopeptide (TPR) repeat protein/DNA-binding winged helix-turn-helix (wHTH) protein
MDFRILGSLEALDEGRRLTLGGSKQRALLGLLLLHVNETLTSDRLIDELWGERPPAGAVKTLQVHVSRLRKTLTTDEGDDCLIVTRERGYELRLDPEQLDARRFERLVAEGRGELVAGRPQLAAAAFERALSLWRGAPLVDLAHEQFAQADIGRLEELRIDALEQLIEAKLELGLHGEVIVQLETLIAEHPYRERLRGQLMLALYRSERQADALQAYQDARRTLVDELGIEPGERLRKLEGAVLAQDPALASRAPEAGPGSLAPPGDPEVKAPERLVEKVQRARGPLEGERKQVTVLFVDIQGSMELAASVDAELWHALLDRFFAIVCEAVHRFEGTVDRFTGDGAMALFGAPIAHEDHARRACHAALRLRDALADYEQEVRRDHGLGFPVRMGLNSGEVVVGTVGEDLQMDYTAVGHTVGLAARMEQLAEPGQPRLTEYTAGLVDGFFQLEDVGELRVKGVQDPVHAYGLSGLGAARTHLDAAAARGLSPFVGRGPEVAALEAALARAGESGQLVGVVAEAGLGKSRLCHEFAERCRERGLRVAVGRGVAHGGQVPLLPVIELLRVWLEIDADDDPAAARAKVASKLLLLDEGLGHTLPVLFDFLGVSDPERPVEPQMTPEARQRTLFASMTRLLHSTAEDRPGVLVVEDMQWLDPGSEAFLTDLVQSLPGARTLLVLNFRPEYQADWMRRSYYQQLPLPPLERKATTRLVHDLAGRDPSLDGLSELIAARTGGNPFFVEEVVQGLVQSGGLVGRRSAYRLAHAIEEIEIPASVHALLAARIDRLPEREKAVLQCAAVIGREFSEPLLGRVSRLTEDDLASSLTKLARAELIYERTLYPDAEYAFKHPLTQEVAYRSQLRERRARTHVAAAGALEALHPDALDELAPLISNHWEEAGEPVRAATWGARAAAWSNTRRPADSLQHWRRVRRLIGDAPETPEAAGLALAACLSILHLGWRLGVPRDEAELVYRQGRDLAAQTGNKRAMAMVRGAYGLTRGTAGWLEDAIVSAQEAKQLAEEAGDVDLQVSVSSGVWLYIAGRHREALADFDRVIEVAGDDLERGAQYLGASAVIYARVFRAVTLMELGRLRAARADAEAALRLAREQNQLELAGAAQGALGTLTFFTGEPGDGVEHAREGLALADRLGSSLTSVTARFQLATALLARDEHQEALQVVSEALDITRTTQTGLQWEPLLLAQRGFAQLGLHDPESAREAAELGASAAANCGARIQEAQARWTLGRALAVLERPAEAKAELERAIELAGDDGPAYIAHALVALADLARRQGDDRERRLLLEEAHRLFEQQGATGHARRLAADIATATT